VIVTAGSRDDFWLSHLLIDVRHIKVLHTIDESLFANLDVTTHVLTWSIVLLADHTDVQNMLRIEVNANKHDVEAYINRNDTLLHYALLESLRVRPLLGLLHTRLGHDGID
jgi:gliotoxin/aspirochlorine/mycotoxins biosynthesis cytochrome P450 monooxygenase